MKDQFSKFINQQEVPSNTFLLMPRLYGAIIFYFYICQLSIINTQFGDIPCSVQSSLNGEIAGFGLFAFINDLYLKSLTLTYFCLITGLVFSLFFILLGYSHILAFLTFILVCSFLVTPCLSHTMGDQLLGAVCFLMIFYPSENLTKVSVWFRRSFLLLIIFIYLSSVYGRLSHSSWKDGVEVWFALAEPTASRLSEYLIETPDAIPSLLIALVTWASFMYEALFPGFLLMNKYRTWLLMVGVSFHLGLALFIQLEVFTPVMIFLLLNSIQGTEISELD